MAEVDMAMRKEFEDCSRTHRVSSNCRQHCNALSDRALEIAPDRHRVRRCSRCAAPATSAEGRDHVGDGAGLAVNNASTVPFARLRTKRRCRAGSPRLDEGAIANALHEAADMMWRRCSPA